MTSSKDCITSQAFVDLQQFTPPSSHLSQFLQYTHLIFLAQLLCLCFFFFPNFPTIKSKRIYLVKTHYSFRFEIHISSRTPIQAKFRNKTKQRAAYTRLPTRTKNYNHSGQNGTVLKTFQPPIRRLRVSLSTHFHHLYRKSRIFFPFSINFLRISLVVMLQNKLEN